ncbi:hypothetical protein DV711_01395 [Motiliproteus coralliicola]|uniref:Glycerol kinase n=1 Tax=Motiliproteus coralliicola TaxID=2283196 RepID=A0A369WRG0_9GAMM|nr:FGGY family carbohydrate kinase [Motiliproteus coralliicola]RDE24272.1 hypothetical protein DV711_01395 [Motiliproteus coralliicola]
MNQDSPHPSPDANHTATDADWQDAPLYLVLDQGGGSSRALLFDHSGNERGRAQQPVQTQYPGPDQVEQSPHELLHSLQHCVDRLLSSLTEPQRRRVRSWGLACQRSNLLGLERHSGQPLTPVLSWQDLRAKRSIVWTPSLTRLVNQRTGLFPSDHHGVSKIRWCLQQPGLRAAAERAELLFSPLSAYLAAGLCSTQSNPLGPLRLDHSCAQRTLLWNRQTLDWDHQLLQQFGIPRQILPSLAHCEDDWGLLRWRELTIPGRFVGGDQGCALFGQGRPKPQHLNLNLGTGAFISLALEELPPHQHRLLTSLASSSRQQTHWMLEGTVNGAASALQWLQREQPKIDLATLQQRPLPLNPGLFLNAVCGLGSPFWDSRVLSRFIDCDNDADRYGAVIESILFLIGENLQAIPATLARPEQINLSGGLSQLPGLAQRLADLTQLPVNLIEQPEATARGLAFILARRPDSWKPSAQQRLQPCASAPLQQRYQRWQQLVRQALKAQNGN